MSHHHHRKGYWLAYLAGVIAHALGTTDQKEREHMLSEGLDKFAQSPACDDELHREIEQMTRRKINHHEKHKHGFFHAIKHGARHHSGI